MYEAEKLSNFAWDGNGARERERLPRGLLEMLEMMGTCSVLVMGTVVLVHRD